MRKLKKDHARTKKDESKLPSYYTIIIIINIYIFFFFEKLTTFREGAQLTYSCHTFSHIQYVFVPKYDYFSLKKTKLDLLLKNVHQF